MKKIFFLVLAFATFQVSAQVSTMPHSIGIGQATLSSIPLHINKNGEVARFQGASPYISFYEGGNWNGFVQAFNNSLGIGTKNSFDLNMYTDDIARFTINGSSGQAFAHQRFNALSGINLTGPLRVAGNNVGSLGDVLMSLGNGTPAWAAVSLNPQIGFRAFTSVDFTIAYNTNNIILNNLSEAYDDGGGDNFNPVTGVYTIPSAGLYNFVVQLPIDNNAGFTNAVLVADLYVNNVLSQRKPITYNLNGSYPNNLEYTYFQKLSLNDQVQFKVFQVNSLSAAVTVDQNFEIVGYKVY